MRILRSNAGNLENGGSVNRHTSNANPLLHDLEPDDELNAATGVKFARANAKQHRDIRIPLGRLALELGHISNVLEFGLCLSEIGSGFTTETSQNVARFFFATDLDEPSRGLREKPYDAKEEEERDNLEGNGKAPSELTEATINIAAAVFEPVSNDNAKNVKSEFDGDELTPRSMFSSFSCPNWNDGV